MPNNVTQQAQFLQTGSPETEHRPADSYTGGALGQLLTVTTGIAASPTVATAKRYQFVQNDSVMDVLPSEGAVAWWLDRANFRVTTNVTVAGRGNIAGIYRCASDVDEFCYVQKEGPGTVLFVDSPTAAPDTTGLFVIPSATPAKADCLASAAAATFPVLGKSAGTQDGTTKLALVDLHVDDGTP